MVSTRRTGGRRRGIRTIGLLCLCSGLSSIPSGCAMLYPVLSTPIRGTVSEDQYDPPPPKDIMFIAIKAARIPSKTRDGRNWDEVGGSAPDAYAVLFVDEQEVLRTVIVRNSLRPEWPNPTPVNLKIAHSAKVRLEVWDDNALVSHPICSEFVRDLQEAVVAGGTEIECDSGATVTLVVQLPKARLGIGLYYEARDKEAIVTRVIAASAAGRAGLVPGDQIIAAEGRPVQSMVAGELEGVFNSRAKNGLSIEVRGVNGQTRMVTLCDEPMYPVKGEGIDILPPTKTN